MGDTGLDCRVLERQPIAVLELIGSLRLDTVSRLRVAVEKILAELPDLVVLDVACLTEVDELCVSIFPTVGRLAAERDVPLVLAAPSPSLRRALRIAPLFVRVAESRAGAMTMRDEPLRSRARWLGLASDARAPVRARNFVEQTYQARGRQDTCEDLVLVANELVTNAVQHVGRGKLGLKVSFLRRYVRIEVHDEDTTQAEVGSGFGLRLVAALSVHWGCEIDHDGGGKVVWAVLPLAQAGRERLQR